MANVRSGTALCLFKLFTTHGQDNSRRSREAIWFPLLGTKASLLGKIFPPWRWTINFALSNLYRTMGSLNWSIASLKDNAPDWPRWQRALRTRRRCKYSSRSPFLQKLPLFAIASTGGTRHESIGKNSQPRKKQDIWTSRVSKN